jgi:hypothetical protein
VRAVWLGVKADGFFAVGDGGVVPALGRKRKDTEVDLLLKPRRGFRLPVEFDTRDARATFLRVVVVNFYYL